MDLLFATNNTHKVHEVRAILRGSGVTVRTLAEAGIDIDPDETGDTFEANALIKARAIQEVAPGWVLADDSGLEVDALGGAPGVHSKRYSEAGTHEANNTKLLAALADVSDRSARFRCVLALVSPDGEIRYVEGACEGRIARSASGGGGFGYDPIFLPAAHPGRSMAELSTDEKNAISHRGRAFQALLEVLP